MALLICFPLFMPRFQFWSLYCLKLDVCLSIFYATVFLCCLVFCLYTVEFWSTWCHQRQKICSWNLPFDSPYEFAQHMVPWVWHWLNDVTGQEENRERFFWWEALWYCCNQCAWVGYWCWTYWCYSAFRLSW